MFFPKKRFCYSFLSLLALQMIGFTESVVLESSTGESYVLDVPFNDSFQNVIEKLNHSLAEVETQNLKIDAARNLYAAAPNGFQMTFTGNALIVRATAMSSPRNYYAPLTADEASDIAYIVKTLSNSYLIDVKLKESTLKSRGSHIDHVHPYNFLVSIFTNQELIVCMRNLQGRSFVWKSFLDGLSNSLTEEKARDNLLQFTQDFAHRIRVDVNAFMPQIIAGKWEKLVDILIKKVPREGDSGRYDM